MVHMCFVRLKGMFPIHGPYRKDPQGVEYWYPEDDYRDHRVYLPITLRKHDRHDGKGIPEEQAS